MAARKKILLVDNHPDAAGSLAAVLRAMGHEVLPVTDPREALRSAKHFGPHLALLDLSMPYVDGYALANMFRGDEATARIPLVALTAYGDDGHRAKAKEAGFHSYVVKPPNHVTLRGIIDQLDA